MKSAGKQVGNYTRVKFIVFFSAAVFLCVVIFSSFWTTPKALAVEEPKTASGSDISAMRQLWEADQLLHLQWVELEKRYMDNSLSNDPATSVNNEAGSNSIADAEEKFSKTLDSIAENSAKTGIVNNMDSIITYFRMALKNRQTQHSINLTLKKSLTNRSTDAIQLTALQTELEAKNNLVAKLQNQLKSIPPQSTSVVNTKSLKENKKIMDEIEFLKWALRSEVGSNHALTKSNNQLKQANANLLNQLKEK